MAASDDDFFANDDFFPDTDGLFEEDMSTSAPYVTLSSLIGLVLGLLSIAIDLVVMSIFYNLGCMHSFGYILLASVFTAIMISTYYMLYFWINIYEKLSKYSTKVLCDLRDGKWPYLPYVPLYAELQSLHM